MIKQYEESKLERKYVNVTSRREKKLSINTDTHTELLLAHKQTVFCYLFSKPSKYLHFMEAKRSSKNCVHTSERDKKDSSEQLNLVATQIYKTIRRTTKKRLRNEEMDRKKAIMLAIDERNEKKQKRQEKCTRQNE